MKRKVLIRHLENQGCEFLREGKKRTVYVNRTSHNSSTVPRHKEINDLLREKFAAI
jgi:mRNA interferase HicA